MSKGSDGRAALRSALPEDYLIRHRDANALKYKYRAQLAGSQKYTLGSLTWPPYWVNDSPDFSKAYSPEKLFDGVEIEAHAPSPVTAHDPVTGNRIKEDEKCALQLHIYSLAGPQQLRTQLAATAEYVQANPQLARTKYVMGVTYPALGRLATTIGFRPMTVETCDRGYELSIHAAHLAFCAINHKQAPFAVSAVYLPTEEFVQRFSQEELGPFLIDN